MSLHTSPASVTVYDHVTASRD